MPSVLASTSKSESLARADGGSNEMLGYKLVLVCRSCGNQWTVLPGPDGEFFPGFWVCPRLCDW